MNRDDFEARVIEMWMKTRIGMTRANLQYWTGAGRRELNKRLDELVGDGVLEVEVDDDGEMIWTVPGGKRSATGATSFADHERRHGAVRASGGGGRASAGGGDVLSTALAVRALGKRGAALAQAGDDKKSALTGAALGLLGPIGWLYSGAFKETVPAAVLAYLAFTILPSILLVPLLAIALPLSAITGGLYALQYNKHGRRGTLFLDGDAADDDDKKLR